MSYEELRGKQQQINADLINLNEFLRDSQFLTKEEMGRIPGQLLGLDTKFRENHAALTALSNTEVTTRARGYFTSDSLAKWEKEYQDVSLKLSKLVEKSTPPPLHRMSGAPGTSGGDDELKKMLAAMQRRLEQLEGRNPDAAQGSFMGDQTLGGSATERLLAEMQAQRDPLKFPVFPKTDAIKKYREWRNAVQNYEITNPSVDSVKLQKLRTSCENSEAASVVALYSVGRDTFKVAMEALDARFYVARVIVSDYMSSAINLTPLNAVGRNDQAKQLKIILDTFKAFEKNIEGICRDSIISKGDLNPSPEVQAKTVCNALYTGLLFRCLDDNMKTRLSTSLNIQATELPEFKAILSAVEKRVVAIQSSDAGKSTSRVVAFTSRDQGLKKNASTCIFHSGSTHSTLECKKFKSFPSAKERFNAVSKAKDKVCWACLEKPYGNCDCKAKGKSCGGCGGFHHRLICFKNTGRSNGLAKGKPTPLALPPKATCATGVVAWGGRSPESRTVPVLGTLIVKILTKKGDYISLRAMVDDGSMLSFITEQAANLIGCKQKHVTKEVTGADGRKLRPIRKEIDILLQNRSEDLDPPFAIVEVGIVGKLPMTLPAQKIKLSLPPNMVRKMADPGFEVPAGVDLLIGGDSWALMKLEGSHRIENCRLQNSIFGYIVQGSAIMPNPQIFSVNTILHAEEHRSIKEDLRRVFEYETPAEEKDDFSETVFSELHRRLPCGRYEVPLIWGTDQELGDSYNVCFRRNQKTFEKLNKIQKDQVINLLRAQRDSDIIQVLPNDKKGKYYNPLVLVWRKTVTTPLRICLDASQKTTNGLSANDIQLVGAKLQPDIVAQLLRFRQHSVAIIADVSQMYLNIRIRSEDRKFQRSILNLPELETQEIEYNTVLFGATCAPFLAQRVVKQLAKDEQAAYPLGAEVLETSTYIDDIIYSRPNLSVAKASLKETISISASAGFDLHKIASNEREVMKVADEVKTLEHLDDSLKTSVLGVQWDYGPGDELSIRYNIKLDSRITKRILLSTIASFFDPLGLAAPAVMPAKFLMQEVWLRDRSLKTPASEASWNKEVDKDIEEAFRVWHSGLAQVEGVKFKRHAQLNKEKIQSLYCFVDASVKGYGAVIYVRTVGEERASFSLICSKGKVAPIIRESSEKIKSLTIPRLELSSALLGAELMSNVKKAWGLTSEFPTVMFTDSEIVLAQLSSSTMRDVFTENRLRKIKKLTKSSDWFHVSSGDNPADLLTRGCGVPDLEGLWKQGPCIMQDINYQPKNKFSASHEMSCNIAMIGENKDMRFPFLIKFSSFKKTCRIMAQIIRAKKILKNNQSNRSGILNAEEISEARDFVIKQAQLEYYANELEALSKGQTIKKGALINKNAFIDSKGILRISTRVQVEQVDYDERNPIVIPPINDPSAQQRHIGYQIIYDAHKNNIHGGVSATAADVRQKYMIPGLRNGISKIIKECQLCVRAKARSFKHK